MPCDASTNPRASDPVQRETERARACERDRKRHREQNKTNDDQRTLSTHVHTRFARCRFSRDRLRHHGGGVVATASGEKNFRGGRPPSLTLSLSVSLSRFLSVCSDTPLKSEDPPSLPTGTQSVSVRHPAQRLGCLHPAAWCSKSGPWRVSFILHHYASQVAITRVLFHSSLETPCSAHVS